MQLLLILLLSILSTCLAQGDPFANAYGSYSVPSATVQACVASQNGFCSGMCCITGVSIASTGTINTAQLTLTFLSTTLSKCGASGVTYTSTLTATASSSTSVQATGQNILGSTSVSVFASFVSQTLSVTLGGPTCAVATGQKTSLGTTTSPTSPPGTSSSNSAVILVPTLLILGTLFFGNLI